MHRTTLTIAVRPQLLDRLDQPRRTVDHGHPGRSQTAPSKSASHFQPVFMALPLTEADVEQDTLAGLRVAPRHQGRVPVAL